MTNGYRAVILASYRHYFGMRRFIMPDFWNVFLRREPKAPGGAYSVARLQVISDSAIYEHNKRVIQKRIAPHAIWNDSKTWEWAVDPLNRKGDK
jgi:hypothetical protein